MPNGATGSPEKRALEENSRQKGCLSRGAEPSHPPHNPRSHPLRLPPWLPVFARRLRLGTLLPLTGSHLRSLGGLKAAQRPMNPGVGVLPQSHGVLQAERGPSTALWGGVWQGILTVPQRRSGWAPGQASGSVIGICCHLAQVRELQKG